MLCKFALSGLLSFASASPGTPSSAQAVSKLHINIEAVLNLPICSCTSSRRFAVVKTSPYTYWFFVGNILYGGDAGGLYSLFPT